jgi:CO/xanthine dehydrogenase FAD-binding subunit
MLALTVALDGVALVHRRQGDYSLPMDRFAVGAQRTALTPGDVLRAIDIPAAALRRRTALRQVSLTVHGRSAALLVGTIDDDGAFRLTITGSTTHPVYLQWPTPPSHGELDDVITGLPTARWHDDVHGAPAWRQHMTRRLAAELLDELAP